MKASNFKLKFKKIKFLLAGIAILLLSIPIILSTPKNTLDNRNYAAENIDTDIVPSTTSGNVTVNQPFSIPLNVIKTSTRSFTISGAQVEITASSRFAFNKDQSHCTSPFTVEYKSLNASTNTISLICSIPQEQSAVSVPEGTIGISFAMVSLTMTNENPAISARIYFNKKKVTESGIPNEAPDISAKTQGIYDYDTAAQDATVAPTTPSPVPTFAGAACDLCGWCPPDPVTNPTKPSNWTECNSCLYDADGLEKKGAYYTVLGCFSTDKSGAPFVQSILQVVFGVAGGFAFLAVLIGAAIVLTSSGNPTRIQTGKDLIFSAIVGLLLILFSVFILRVVGFDILRIPGVG